MDYNKHYNNLINRARLREVEGYTEIHHVIPKCLNGTDHSSNLVRLTPEEHYVAHQLLIKIYPDNKNLAYAAMKMTIGNNKQKRNNKLYGWIKRKYQLSCKEKIGDKNTQYGTFWITNGIQNRKINSNDIIPMGWHRGRKSVHPPIISKSIRKCCSRKKVKNKKKKEKIICPISGKSYNSKKEYIETQSWTVYPNGRIHTITKLADAFGITLGKNNTEQLLDEAVATLKQAYHEEKLSTLLIHEKYKFNCSEGHVANILKALGISRRNLSESAKILKLRTASV